MQCGHITGDTIVFTQLAKNQELQNAIQRYLVVGRIEFIPGDSFETPEPSPPPEQKGQDEAGPLRLSESMEDAERAVIRKALEQHQGNKTLAAEALGVSRRTLSRKLNRLGLVWNPKQ